MLGVSSFKVNDSLAVDFDYADNANLIVDGLTLSLTSGVDNVNVLADIGTTSTNITLVINFLFSNAIK